MTSTNTEVSLSTYRTLNPATGELLHTWPVLDDTAVEALIDRAYQAFLTWRHVPISERVRLFSKMAELLEKNADALGRQTSLEMGGPLPQTVAQAKGAAEMFSYYAEHGPELLADEEIAVPGLSRAIVSREPVGVILGVEPWNAPVYQSMRAAAPNLMLGNTVIVKPAEITPGSTLMLDDLFLEAGFPAGAYQTGLLNFAQVSTLIADPRVRGVTLTGSDRAGSAVGEQASRHIKPVVLELGGSDAFVVLDSANIELAAQVGATCRLIIGGQACALPKRVIVTEAVADEFIEKFLPLFSGQVIGDPFDPTTTLGPMSSARAADLLQEQLQDAIDKGATVLVEGGSMDGPGAYFRPAVVTGITPDMRLYHEEAFGPPTRRRPLSWGTPPSTVSAARCSPRTRTRPGGSRAPSTLVGWGSTHSSAPGRSCRSAGPSRLASAGSWGGLGWTSSPTSSPTRCRNTARQQQRAGPGPCQSGPGPFACQDLGLQALVALDDIAVGVLEERGAVATVPLLSHADVVALHRTVERCDAEACGPLYD
jgi:succinate-semialdehyde dehydrogenase / glutarate-semialdehyde dehydrogenase